MPSPIYALPILASRLTMTTTDAHAGDRRSLMLVSSFRCYTCPRYMVVNGRSRVSVLTTAEHDRGASLDSVVELHRLSNACTLIAPFPTGDVVATIYDCLHVQAQHTEELPLKTVGRRQTKQLEKWYTLTGECVHWSKSSQFTLMSHPTPHQCTCTP